MEPKSDAQNGERLTDKEFQFPSNGKVEPKTSIANEMLVDINKVSIPFKRESGDKGK